MSTYAERLAEARKRYPNFASMTADQRRMACSVMSAIPLPTIQVVTLAWSPAGSESIHSIPVIVDRPYTQVSNIIHTWLDSPHGTLLDWRVDDYAPIPF